VPANFTSCERLKKVKRFCRANQSHPLNHPYPPRRSYTVVRSTPDEPVEDRRGNYFKLYQNGTSRWITAMGRDEECPTMFIPEGGSHFNG
jgi:hypothetical protein